MKSLCTRALILPIVLMTSGMVYSLALLPTISHFSPELPPEFNAPPPPPSQGEPPVQMLGLPASCIPGEEAGSVTFTLGKTQTPPLPIVQQVFSVRHEYRNVRNLSEKHLVLEARFRVVAGLSFARGPLCVQVRDWEQEGKTPQFCCPELNERAVILSCEMEGRPNLMLSPGVMNAFTGDDIVEAYSAVYAKARAAAAQRLLPEVERHFSDYLLHAQRSGSPRIIQL